MKHENEQAKQTQIVKPKRQSYDKPRVVPKVQSVKSLSAIAKERAEAASAAREPNGKTEPVRVVATKAEPPNSQNYYKHHPYWKCKAYLSKSAIQYKTLVTDPFDPRQQQVKQDPFHTLAVCKTAALFLQDQFKNSHGFFSFLRIQMQYSLPVNAVKTAETADVCFKPVICQRLQIFQPFTGNHICKKLAVVIKHILREMQHMGMMRSNHEQITGNQCRFILLVNMPAAVLQDQHDLIEFMGVIWDNTIRAHIRHVHTVFMPLDTNSRAV